MRCLNQRVQEIMNVERVDTARGVLVAARNEAEIRTECKH